MLGVFAMTHEAGLFRVAMSLYAATTLVGGLLNSVAAPVLVRLHHAGDTRSVMRLNAGIAASLVATSATALLAMIVFGRLLLGSIFGADFAPATLILIVLLGFELLATLVGNPVLALSMLGRGHAASRLSVVTMIAAVGLSLALIPSFGALGAAMALGASQMSWRMLCWWDARRHLGVETSLLAVFQVLKGRRAARLDV